MSENLAGIYEQGVARRETAAAEAEAAAAVDEEYRRRLEAELSHETLVEYATDLAMSLRASTHPAVLSKAAAGGDKALYAKAELDKYDWDCSFVEKATGEEKKRYGYNIPQDDLELVAAMNAKRRAQELRDQHYDAHAVRVHHPSYYSVSGSITPATDTRTGTTIPARDEYGVVVQWALPPRDSAEARELPGAYYAERID